MNGWKKYFALLVGLVIGVGAIAVLGSISSGSVGNRHGPQGAQPVVVNQEEDAQVGKPFAESLGLPTIEKLSDGCMYAAEAPPDQTLYCLDGVADNYVEARVLGYRVNGRVPTELEERLAELLAEEDAILATSDNEASLLEIRDQIVEVVKQINLAKNAG